MSDAAVMLALAGVLCIVLWMSFGPGKEGFDKKMSMLDLQEFDALDPELKGLYKDTVGRVVSTVLGKLSGGWRLLSDAERSKIKKDFTAGVDKATSEINGRVKDSDVANLMRRLPVMTRGIPDLAKSTLAPKKSTAKPIRKSSKTVSK